MARYQALPHAILHPSFAIAIRLVGDRERRRRAGCQRAVVRAFDVVEIDVQRHRPRLVFARCFAHLDERVAHAHRRMHHASLGIGIAPEQFRAERRLQERDHRVGIGNQQIRPDRGKLRRHFFSSHRCHLILHRRNQLRQQLRFECGIGQRAQIARDHQQRGQLRLGQREALSAIAEDRFDRIVEPFDQIALSHDSYPFAPATSAGLSIEVV